MFRLHCHVFTRFFDVTELKHVTAQSFVSFNLTERASNWSTWNCLNSLNVFCLKQALTRITDHCRALLPPLAHCRALWQLWLLQLVEGLSNSQPWLTEGWLTFHWEDSTNWCQAHWGCLHCQVQTVPATVSRLQHCTPAGARTGKDWRLPRHCFQTARCRTPPTHWRNSTAMGTVDQTVEILTGLAFKGDVVTTGQTAQSMCFATTLTTAKEILDTGIIPISVFTNSQLVHSQVCTASSFPDLLVWIHWLTVTARAYDTDSVQPCTSQVLDFNDCSSTDVQPCGRGEEGGGTHCL